MTNSENVRKISRIRLEILSRKLTKKSTSIAIQLTISEAAFLENMLRILKWDSERQCQLLRKPVEKHKWSTEPAVVNAFYNPNRNDIGKCCNKFGPKSHVCLNDDRQT